MIIVEGPDGAGKTTLIAKILAAYPDLDLAPRVVSKETNDLTDLQQWVNTNLALGPQYTLFDRHRLISEFIYGPVLRKELRPGFSDRLWVHHSLRRFQQTRPVIIYCLPPLSVVKENISGDESNRKVWDHVEQIYGGYVHRATMDWLSGQNVIIYDYTTDGQEDDPLGCFHYAINNMKERTS